MRQSEFANDNGGHANRLIGSRTEIQPPDFLNDPSSRGERRPLLVAPLPDYEFLELRAESPRPGPGYRLALTLLAAAATIATGIALARFALGGG